MVKEAETEKYCDRRDYPRTSEQKNKKMRELQDRLDELTANPDVEHDLINIEFGMMDKISALNKARREGIEEGREEGESRGRSESKEMIAKKLIKMKMPIEKIAEATGLSIEKIVILKVK